MARKTFAPDQPVVVRRPRYADREGRVAQVNPDGTVCVRFTDALASAADALPPMRRSGMYGGTFRPRYVHHT